MLNSGDGDWALFAKSVLDRTRLSLTSKAESYHQLLQPSAEYLGAKLGVDQWAVCLLKSCGHFNTFSGFFVKVTSVITPCRLIYLLKKLFGLDQLLHCPLFLIDLIQFFGKLLI